MATTIVDIACQVGVSPRTVSRVLNTGGYVSEKVRRRVVRVAEELDYQPHAIARSFALRKTGNIGFVLCYRTLSHPFYFRVLEAVEKEVSRQGYRVIFSSAEEFLAERASFPRLLKEKVLDGILITGKINSQLLNILKSRGLPVVVIGSYDLGGQVNMVGSDVRQTGYRVAQHLLNAGHQRIGFLSGPLEYFSHQEMLKGYKSALEEFGINYEEDLIQEDEQERVSGLIEKLWENFSPPTALCTVNDKMAIEAMNVLRQREINIPAEVSIIGYGDYESSPYVTPPLTSVKTTESEVAQKAVGKLIEEISGKNTEPFNIITGWGKLVIRESVAPPLQKA